jgi:hypothetical protein
MRHARPPLIPTRRRIFLGCEGQSEQGYGALLRDLLDVRRQDVHLDVVLLGGGEPLTLIQRSRDRLRQTNRDPYELRALLLDTDRLGNAQRDAEAMRLAKTLELNLIWQKPCHEALLLRHLEGLTASRPADSDAAMTQLRRAWTTYEKGLSARRLSQEITYEAVVRASTVEPELRVFLEAIGFL